MGSPVRMCTRPTRLCLLCIWAADLKKTHENGATWHFKCFSESIQHQRSAVKRWWHRWYFYDVVSKKLFPVALSVVYVRLYGRKTVQSNWRRQCIVGRRHRQRQSIVGNMFTTWSCDLEINRFEVTKVLLPSSGQADDLGPWPTQSCRLVFWLKTTVLESVNWRVAVHHFRDTIGCLLYTSPSPRD